MNEMALNRDIVEIEQRSFIINVYKWMSMGLFLTAVIAYIVSTSHGLVQLILGNKLVFYGLLTAEIAAVWYFAACVRKMSAFSAMLLFLGYAALNGLTFSLIFLIYTASSIVSTFLITSGTFGAMSLYGYVTKRDLTTIGNICFMALIGLIIASIVNIFMHSSIIYWITTYMGILIFVGLTAYDTKKIKKLNIIGNKGTDEEVKESINGALILYLDFINLFIYMLSLFGRRR